MIWPHRLAPLAACVCALTIASCAKKDSAATDTTLASVTTTDTPAPAPPTSIKLSDIAGTWNLRSVPATGDTTPTVSVLEAKNDTSGWTITFPGRGPIAEHVTVSGDSIILASEPYQSVRRKGVRVTTSGVLRLQNGNIVGRNTAHYSVKTADSVMVFNTTGTRAR